MWVWVWVIGVGVCSRSGGEGRAGGQGDCLSVGGGASPAGRGSRSGVLLSPDVLALGPNTSSYVPFQFVQPKGEKLRADREHTVKDGQARTRDKAYPTDK